MRELWPPLAEIAEHVRIGPTLAVAEPPELAAQEALAAPPVLSGLLLDEIRRTTAAGLAEPQPVEPGSIVLIDGRRDGSGRLLQRIDHPVCFCLDRHALPRESGEGRLWMGWIAAPELDYASDLDAVLEPSDEPFDPQAGMIQVWNPATVWVPGKARHLGKLSPERLAAIRALSHGGGSSSSEADSPHPGHVHLRTITEKHLVLTGTPLGVPSVDPRHAYQDLYRQLAGALTQAQAANEPSIVPHGGVLGWVGRHRPQSFALAASLFVAVVAVSMFDAGRSRESEQLASVSPLPSPSGQPDHQAERRPAPAASPESPNTALAGEVDAPSSKSVPPRPAATADKPKGRKVVAPNASTELAGVRPQGSDGIEPPPTDVSGSDRTGLPYQLAYLEPLDPSSILNNDSIVVRGKTKAEESRYFRLRLKNWEVRAAARQLLFELDVAVVDQNAGNATLDAVISSTKSLGELERKIRESGLFLLAAENKGK